MRRALTGLRTAVAALTVVPMGRFRADPPAAVGWYAWVGWLFAAAGVGVASAASPFIAGTTGSLLVGVVVVAVWAGLSGLVHWDGLADTADGLLGGHTPERRLEIMADSSVGAFGSVAVTLAVLAQVVCVAALFESRDWWVIGAAPVAGRFAATWCVLSRRPARSSGLGASAASRFSVLALVLGSLAVALTLAGVLAGTPASLSLGVEHALLAAFGVAFGAAAGLMLTRPIGGYTGDVLGACILLTEAAVLFAGAVWQSAAGAWPL